MDEVRLESDGLAVCGDRFVQLPLREEGVAEVVVGLGVIRFEADRLAVCGDRLLQLPLLAKGEAEAVVGQGVIGLEPQVSRNSAIASSSFPRRLKALSEVQVDRGLVALEPDFPAENRDRFVQGTLAPRQVAAFSQQVTVARPVPTIVGAEAAPGP